MTDALKAVVDDRQSVYGAAKKFHDPRRTLEDSVKGRIKHAGPQTLLSKEEEKALCPYLIHTNTKNG